MKKCYNLIEKDNKGQYMLYITGELINGKNMEKKDS